jgi:hypothetical protein
MKTAGGPSLLNGVLDQPSTAGIIVKGVPAQYQPPVRGGLTLKWSSVAEITVALNRQGYLPYWSRAAGAGIDAMTMSM